MSEKNKNLANYLSKDAHYLLACSYGPDSMALFYLLVNDGYSFDVAHVNYHLREESDEEEKSLRKVCKKYKIPLYVKEVENGAITDNIEGTCRLIRYNFFLDLAKENGYDGVLIAHQEDDLIETYFLQCDRGAIVDYYGLRSVSSYQDMTIIRPLLSYTKRELLDICDSHKIPYAIDITNSDITYKRNKYRREVVSDMDRARRDEILSEINAKNSVHLKLINSLKNLDLHSVDTLLTLDEYQLQNALIILLNETQTYHALSRKTATNINKALLSKKPNICINLGEICFEKSYGECRFYIDKRISYSYVISMPQVVDTPYFHFDLLHNNKFSVSSTDYPLTIRNASGDDLVRVSDYQVKVSRLYIDWKMPLKYRPIWPIVINSEGKAIYIPRYQKDFTPTESDYFYVKI
ncbi:MAG: tRNA lysidine(34) synthetase TilS [Coprobacillus sp.]|nr:tRNA lysidine(34) synthetase TilS [Coprobacillus sp.]